MSAEISRWKCDYGSMIEWWQCSHTEFSSSQLQTQNCSFWSPRSLRNLACVERLSLGPSGPGVHMFQHILVPFSNFAVVVALGCCYFITGDPLLLSFLQGPGLNTFAGIWPGSLLQPEPQFLFSLEMDVPRAPSGGFWS